MIVINKIIIMGNAKQNKHHKKKDQKNKNWIKNLNLCKKLTI